jgi:23S rRNA (pseudouridine1915-N3)-methyltransferase
LIELDESRARRPEDRKREEAAALDQALGADWRRVALDERGRTIGTAEFVSFLQRMQESGARGVAFLVGGADGLDPALVAGAELKIAFGAMTLPHQFVRILVAEQLYRATTIIAGHPYNRP